MRREKGGEGEGEGAGGKLIRGNLILSHTDQQRTQNHE